MRDVAQRAGVSVAAVSSVLRGSRNIGVSAETRQNILRHAKTADYVYPRCSSRPDQPFSLLVISPYPFDGLMAKDTLAGIEQGLIALKGRMMINLAEEAVPLLTAGDSKLLEGLAGVIFLSRLQTDCAAALRRRDIPYVVVGSGEHYPDVDMVYPDPPGYGFRGIDYLRSLGHERIGLLIGSQPHYSYRTIICVFQSYLQEKFGRISPHLIGLLPPGLDPADVLAGMLRHDERPTAVLGAASAISRGVLKLGLRIPEDLSALAFNVGSVEGGYASFSYIGVDNVELGREGVQALLRRRDNRAAPVRHVILPVKVIENGSCRQRS